MPYKSEKIKIANTKHDKRIKLDEDDKEQIVKKYYQGQSMRSLSREYKVDRQVIKYTIFPNYKEEMYKRNKEYLKTYEVDKETRNEYARKHRKHKQDLYLKGEIKWNSQ
jgi:hypothetical protein